MASLPSLPPLGPIVLQFPFGFDATFDASSELGGDAAIPEAVPASEPVSVPEAVTSPESTAVPEVVTNEVVAPPVQAVTTTLPAPKETGFNEAQTECSTVEKIETVEAAEPVPVVRRSSTVVVTVPAEGAELQNVIEPRPLSRRSTTITITVSENEAAPPSRKPSLPTPRTEFVKADSTDANFRVPVRAQTVNLEGGTSVTVTETSPSVAEAPPAKEIRVPPKKVKRVKVVKRVRVMGLWRRIIAKVMRKRAEKKAQQAMGADGTISPQDATEASVRSDLHGSVNRRPEPEVAGNASEMRTDESSRVPVDDFLFHDGTTQSDVVNSTDAALSRQGPRKDTAHGS